MLKSAAPGVLCVKHPRQGALCFLDRVRKCGSTDALYMVGMLRTYVLLEWGIGGELLARAAERNHGPTLFQCAVSLSGSAKKLDANPEGANELLFRALALGYKPAGLELGIRISTGWGFAGNRALGIRVIKSTRIGDFQKAKSLVEGLIRKRDGHYPFSSSFLPASLIVDWSRKSTPEIVSPAFQKSWRALAVAAHQTLCKQEPRSREFTYCGNSECGRLARDANDFRDCRNTRYCSVLCANEKRRRSRKSVTFDP